LFSGALAEHEAIRNDRTKTETSIMNDQPARPFSRRDFLGTVGALSVAGLGSTLGASRNAHATTAAVGDIVSMPAYRLSAAIHLKEVSCREVMTAYLDHIDRVNPKVNAIVARRERSALLAEAAEKDAQLASGQSSGWMHGMPQAPKDLAATKGIVTTFGSPIFRNHIPQADAFMVERMRRAGAIFIGKTNTPEFGLGSQTYNTVYGPTRNPYDPSKTCGGSSGGAATSLALRMLPVADGSDFAGSLRNPAAFCNVYGFRPSEGRVPYGPTGEVFVQQLGYEGAMGRTVKDIAMLLSDVHRAIGGGSQGPPHRVARRLERLSRDGARHPRPVRLRSRDIALDRLRGRRDARALLARAPVAHVPRAPAFPGGRRTRGLRSRSGEARAAQARGPLGSRRDAQAFRRGHLLGKRRPLGVVPDRARGVRALRRHRGADGTGVPV
jgi:hypothetical protein